MKKKAKGRAGLPHADWFRNAGMEVTCDDPEVVTAICRKTNRRFRLIPSHDLFQICDGNFDRWANSVGAEEKVPYDEDKFGRVLARLLSTVK